MQVESKDDTADEARSIDQIDTKSVKKEENNEHASAELLDKIKNQVEVIYLISVFLFFMTLISTLNFYHIKIIIARRYLRKEYNIDICIDKSNYLRLYYFVSYIVLLWGCKSAQR